MRFILAGSLLAGLKKAAPWISSPEMAMRDPGRAAAIVRPGDGRRRRASSDVAMRARGRWPPPATWCHRRQWRCCSSTCAAWSSRHRRMRRCSSEAKKPPRGVEAASPHAVQGGRNRAGDQGGKPRGLMCSSATLAGFSTYPMRTGPPWALLDLLLLFSTCFCSLVLLLSRAALLQLAMSAASLCLIQRP